MYTGIFNCFFATKSIEDNILGPVSTYFNIVETNNLGILYLYYLL